MKITNAYLAECEKLLSQDKTSDVITRLMAVREATAYKSEVISLSSRWRHQQWRNTIRLRKFRCGNGHLPRGNL